MKIYWAAPLFTMAEFQWNRGMAGYLRHFCGIDVLLPQEMSLEGKTSEQIARADIAAMKSCDAIVAVMDGPDPDSGTAFEVAFALGEGKPVLGVRTDLRSCGDTPGGSVNAMLEGSIRILRWDRRGSMSELAEALAQGLEYVMKTSNEE